MTAIEYREAGIRLTAMASSAGCAAKVDPGHLARVLQPLQGLFPAEQYPALLVGLAEPDDAAVYRISDEQAIISTVDFFPPVVDDPYAFGAIAAANALSDVYAMGGQPLFAINLAAFPDDRDLTMLSDILRGGAEKVREAGAAVVGGHTIVDKEPKYGLAVTGMVHPGRIFTKGGAQPGDRLILSKRLGTGTITTALKRGAAHADAVEAAIASMMRLNRDASAVAIAVGAHALTDVTGYSLMGHGHEMAHWSGADFVFDFDAFPLLPRARDYAQAGIFPGGLGRNQRYYGQWVTFDDAIAPFERDLCFDPQTSGGLLMAVAPEKADEALARLRDAGDPAAAIGWVRAPAAEAQGGLLHIQRGEPQ